MIGLLSAFALAAAPTLAVLDLENRTGDPSLDAAGPGVAQVLVSKFARVDEVVVVERERVEDVLGELALQRTKAIDDASAVRVGKVLGAKYLVMGQLFSVKMPNVVVSLRIVDVETGQVVVAKDVTGEIGADGSEFFVLIDEVGFEILDALQIRLDASDRIEFGQIDVHRLDTVKTFGKAIEALDAGKDDEAQRLLSEALALEPGFRIAEDELDRIAAAIVARRATIAHDAVTKAHAAWDKFRPVVIERTKTPAPTGDGAVWMALRGRMFLVDGQLVEHVAWEERRAQWTRDNWAAILASLATDYPESKLESLASDTLKAHGLDEHRAFSNLVFLPVDVRMDVAHVLVVLGRGEEAAALLISAYQDPGPLLRAQDKPPDPLRRAENLGLHDLVVVLYRQQLRLAELEGDEREASHRLSKLDDAVDDAKDAREAKKACEVLAARIAREAASSDLLWQEERCARAAADTPALALAGYQAFNARVEKGYYDKVRADDRFEDLAEQWYNTLLGAAWDRDWYADQRVAALLALHEQLPTTDAEELARREEKVRSSITGWYPK